jgi:hypothetical protein
MYGVIIEWTIVIAITLAFAGYLIYKMYNDE